MPARPQSRPSSAIRPGTVSAFDPRLLWILARVLAAQQGLPHRVHPFDRGLVHDPGRARAGIVRAERARRIGRDPAAASTRFFVSASRSPYTFLAARAWASVALSPCSAATICSGLNTFHKRFAISASASADGTPVSDRIDAAGRKISPNRVPRPIFSSTILAFLVFQLRSSGAPRRFSGSRRSPEPPHCATLVAVRRSVRASGSNGAAPSRTDESITMAGQI